MMEGLHWCDELSPLRLKDPVAETVLPIAQYGPLEILRKKPSPRLASLAKKAARSKPGMLSSN